MKQVRLDVKYVWLEKQQAPKDHLLNVRIASPASMARMQHPLPGAAVKRAVRVNSRIRPHKYPATIAQ